MQEIGFPLALAWVVIIILSVSVIKLWIEIKALMNSTHRVQYVDPTSQPEPTDLTEEERKALESDPFDNIV